MTPRTEEAMDCPNRHGRMNRIRGTKTVTLGCNVWDFDADVYVCPVCGLEADPPDKLPSPGAASPDP